MPTLSLYGNDWALLELPANAARFWSREETLAAVRTAGFDGVQAPSAWGGEVHAAGLHFAAYGRANTPAEIATLARNATVAGALFATLHVGWGVESDDEMDALAAAVLDAQDACGLPLWPETHRATMLQDLWRTLRLLERFPALRLNLDASHYYCGGEFPYRRFEANCNALRPILHRTACFHGRVSNGQIMQVLLADPAYAENVGHFAMLWSEAMAAWKAAARPGEVLPFIPELGPPSSGYALTMPDATQPRGRCELSDRWAEMQALGQLARALFEGRDFAAELLSQSPVHQPAAI